MSDWHYTDIESAVKRRCGSYAGLAREWNAQHPKTPVGRDTLVKAARRRQSALGERVISWAVGVPADEIWPSRYDDDGKRIRLNAWSRRKANNVKSYKGEIFNAPFEGETHD